MKRALLMITATGVLLGSAAAWASTHPSPTTTPVSAEFLLTTVSDTGVNCTGTDGTYADGVNVSRGPIRGTDPHLNGTLQVTNDYLVNADTGDGSSHGTFKITGPDGSVLVKGTFSTATIGSLSGSK